MFVGQHFKHFCRQLKNEQLKIWGRVQREVARRRKSDGGGVNSGDEIYLVAKSTCLLMDQSLPIFWFNGRGMAVDQYRFSVC